MAARTRAERKAEADDLAAQEHGPGVKPTKVATSYVHAKHPDHGEDVVFVPGELLPDWVEED